MKKKFIVAVLVIALCVGILSACTPRNIERADIFEYEPYSEEAFRTEMAKSGENKISFAVSGDLIYDTIVYPDNLDEITVTDGKYDKKDRFKVELRNSVTFLADTLKKMTGDNNISVIPESEYSGEKAIILTVGNVDGLGVDGDYSLNIGEESVTIKANNEQGVSSGIYDFLETKLGCMFVSNDYDYIPSLNTICLDKESKKVSPSIKWREIYSYYTEKNGEAAEEIDYLGWHSKLRLNGAASDNWYHWCHTSFTYIPPEKYFDEHPEYFSYYLGKRTYKQGPVSGQLCWTNEDVYKIISEQIFKEMAENPDIHIWDISQMDTWISRGIGCTCDKCKAIDDKEGSQMGSLLTFVNRLADECKVKFPDNYISTLAYNYTVEPPKNLKPRDNVIIKLCLMPGDVASSYAEPTSKAAKDANKVVEEWGKIAKHIVIWDYNIDFHNYLMPYPILRHLDANNEFYIDNNVYGIFHQMGRDKGGDMDELNSYIFARLMWDENVDVKAIINKYLTVYYGDAAPYIAKYMSDLDYNAQKANKDMYIYSTVESHVTDYLSPKNINSYLDTLDKALESVKGNEALTKRVNRVRLSVLFAKAEQFDFDMNGRRDALEEFMTIAKENDVTSLIEGESNGDEIANFYNRNNGEIIAIPFILTGIILGSILVVALIIIVPFMIKRRILKRQMLKKLNYR